MDTIQAYSSSNSSASSVGGNHSEIEQGSSVAVQGCSPKQSITSGSEAISSNVVHNQPSARRWALPSPATLLDLPVDALGNLNAPHRQHDLTAAKYQGRKRSFPHVEGDFATHVYTEVRLTSQHRQHIASAIGKLQSSMPGLQGLDTAESKGTYTYHMSLSHTVSIRYHQIDALLKSLKNSMQSQQSFQASLGGWKVFVNDQGTRTFLAIGMASGSNEMNTMIDCVNATFKSHSLQTFYQEPDAHISVAWLLGDERIAMEAAIQSSSLEVLDLQQRVKAVHCAIGKRISVVWSG